MDRPENGIFRAKDLRLRIELEGEGVRAIKLPAGTFALQAGENELAVVPCGELYLTLTPITLDRINGALQGGGSEILRSM